HRAAQTRCERGGGRGLSAHYAGCREAGREHRDLRRSPHGDELLAGRVRRGAGAHPGSAVRRQDLPRLFRRAGENPRMSAPVIAIDGPSASGKGTIASRVAKRLGFHYLESGALYRLVALLSLREGTMQENRLVELAEEMDVLFDDADIVLGDESVTEKVRSEPVGIRASEVARLPQL